MLEEDNYSLKYMIVIPEGFTDGGVMRFGKTDKLVPDILVLEEYAKGIVMFKSCIYHKN